MPVPTSFPIRDSSPEPRDSRPRLRDSSSRMHRLQDPLDHVTQTAETEVAVIARPRAIAAAAAALKLDGSLNATMLGMLPQRADTNSTATILGLGVTQMKELEAAVQRVRLAEGSAPRKMPAPKIEAKQASAETVEPQEPQEPQELKGPQEPQARVALAPRWQAFEDIGLKPNPITNKASKLVVSSYRLLGFAILTLIVITLVGYIVTTAFYVFNHTWVTPVAVSASDEKVVALSSELAAQQTKRDAIADDLDQSDRAIAAEQRFQLEFAKAIAHDLDGRKVALGRVRGLALAAASARVEIRRSNDAYAASSKQKLTDELAAGLIDRRDMLAGKYQLAQISSSSLSLAERQAEFEQRATELAAQTQALDAILGDKLASTALSYDVLQIKRQYETSKLALTKEVATRTSLQASLGRLDKIIDGVQHSAHLRAIADHATIAFVPYGNLAKVEKGGRLYGCKLGMVLCHAVGTIVDVLPGEVAFKHPRRDKLVRGQMIEMKLDEDEGSAAEDDVLFAGGRPLFL